MPRQKDKEQVEDQRQQQAKDHASQDSEGILRASPPVKSVPSEGTPMRAPTDTIAIFAMVATRIPAIMTGTARGR